jgi:hypothetical protein
VLYQFKPFLLNFRADKAKIENPACRRGILIYSLLLSLRESTNLFRFEKALSFLRFWFKLECSTSWNNQNHLIRSWMV